MSVVERDSGFDSLRTAESLREAGVEDRQAKAIAGAVRDGRRGPVTKADLDNLEDRIVNRLTGRVFTAAGLVVAVMVALKLFG